MTSAFMAGVGAARSLPLSLYLCSPGREVDGQPAGPVVLVSCGIEVEPDPPCTRRRGGVADFALAELAAAGAVCAGTSEIAGEDIGTVLDSHPDPRGLAHRFG